MALEGSSETLIPHGPLFGEQTKWTVGVTDDLERRWKEHGKPSAWKPFLVGNGIISRAVESALKKKGMSGDTGGPGNATYLYIFITASKTA